MLDPLGHDTYDSLRLRSPWTINSLLAVAAARMPNPSTAIQHAAEAALEEAHGIARSSLFGPTVKMEAVLAMFLCAAWEEGSWLGVGHAVRMGAELGLDKTLTKLRDNRLAGVTLDEQEERAMVSAVRLVLCMIELDWSLSNKSGRPYAVVEAVMTEDKLDAFTR